MSEQLINEYVDRSAFSSDTDFIKNQVKEALDAFTKLSKTKVILNVTGTGKEAAASIKAVNDELAKSVKTSNDATAASKKAAQQLLLEAKARESNAGAVKNEAEARRANAQAAAIERKEAEAAAKAQEKARRETEKQANAYEKLKKQYREVSNEAKRLGAEFGTSSRQFKNAAAEASKLNDQLLKIERSVGQNQRNVGNYGAAIRGFGKDILFAAGAMIGINSAFQAFQFLFQTNLKFDSLNAAIKQLSGSSEEFAINQSFLKKTANDLGLGIVDLTKAFKNFYAAATTAGLSTGATRDIFEKVSRSAAQLKLSQDDVNGVFTAFGQIISKGKVQAEELRGQIGERIPGAFAIAAKSLGVTTAELDKMLKSGQVIAKDFLPKFAEELEKTFGGGTGQVEGLQASINRFQNRLADIVNDESGGLNQFFSKVVNFFTNALDGAEKFFSFFYNKIDPAKAKLQDINRAFGDAYNEQKGKSIGEITQALNDNIIAAQKAAKDVRQLAAEYKYFKNQANAQNLKSAATVFNEQDARTKGIRKALLDAAKKDVVTAVEGETEEERKAREKAAKQRLLDGIRAEQAWNREMAKVRRLNRIQEDFGAPEAGPDLELEKLKATAEKRKAFLEADKSDRLRRNEELFSKGIIQLEEYENEKARITTEGDQYLIKAEIDYTEQIIALAKSRGEDVAQQEATLAALKLKYAETVSAALKKTAKADAKEEAKDLKERQKLIKEALKDLQGELFNLASVAVGARFENEKNALQDQIDLIEKKKQAEIEAINATTASAEEKAAKIKLIEARAAAQKEQLELRQRQADQRNARFQKALSISQIIITTAQAVVRGLKDGGPVLAAIYAAIGAAQIAAVIAQPIPRYKMGTANHPGGLAVVGDGGKQEVVVTPDGKAALTPATDTVMNLPKGTVVHPDVKAFAATNHRDVALSDTVNNAVLESLMKDHIKATKAIGRAIQEQPVYMPDGSGGMRVKRGNEFTHYINQNVKY